MERFQRSSRNFGVAEGVSKDRQAATESQSKETHSEALNSTSEPLTSSLLSDAPVNSPIKHRNLRVLQEDLRYFKKSIDASSVALQGSSPVIDHLQL